MDAVQTVVSNHAAPQGVVQIEEQRLLVLSEQGLDHVCRFKGNKGDILRRDAVLVSVVVSGIRERIQTVPGGCVFVVQKKQGRGFFRGTGKRFVQVPHEADSAGRKPAIGISQDPDAGKIEVVLQNRAAVDGQSVPDRAEALCLRIQFLPDCPGTVARVRKVPDGMKGGIDPDQIRGEILQFRVAENGVLVETVVTALKEGRADPVGEQEDLQDRFQFPDGGTGKDGDLLVQQVLLLQKLLFQRPAFRQDLVGIERLGKHQKPP